MKSQRPKVLHHLAGRPMLQHVIDTSRVLHPDQVIVVIGHHADLVREALQGQPVEIVEQHQQLGTGHAVAQCLEVLKEGNDVLVLYGDVPMIRAETLSNLVDQTEDAVVRILSFIPENASGYGRIVRQPDNRIKAIVEEKDATDEQKNLKESNSGIMLIAGNQVGYLINRLDNKNAQSEYYLTDIVKHAVSKGMNVSACVSEDVAEILGVNNQQQLAEIETLFRQRQAHRLMVSGAKLYDPARIDIRGRLNVGSDVVIDVNCVFIGEVHLGNNVHIGANCIIENSTIGDDSTILPMTSIDSSVFGKGVSIGPFARIRPNTECADEVKIGNFVETKKARIGPGSKVSHLSYIGDTEMGAGVNIGAGTITCNYDGVNKFKTIIEDNVFVGSDTQLIAPVTLGQGSTIGAGSTITRDTPADQLTLCRSKQTSIKGWHKPVKK
jgi:bifunctional UDP-N-acetylglucosamine pyrophosphorylase/glucosamine-1-phosphate N-acetyltransferase